MPRHCTICVSTRSSEINALLLENELSYREIAARFYVAKDALSRHWRNHLPHDDDEPTATSSAKLGQKDEAPQARQENLQKPTNSASREATEPRQIGSENYKKLEIQNADKCLLSAPVRNSELPQAEDPGEDWKRRHRPLLNSILVTPARANAPTATAESRHSETPSDLKKPQISMRARAEESEWESLWLLIEGESR